MIKEFVLWCNFYVRLLWFNKNHKFENLFRNLFVAKSRSWGMAAFLCLKMRLRKNFSTKRGSFGQFLIRIRIRDSNPDSNQDSDPDSNPDPDSKLTAGRIRIRPRIRNFCFGSATLPEVPVLTMYWKSHLDVKVVGSKMFPSTTDRLAWLRLILEGFLNQQKICCRTALMPALRNQETHAKSSLLDYYQCYGSTVFWCGSGYGSGSADPCLCLMDPNPAISCKQKTKFLFKVCLLITFWRYIFIIFIIFQRWKVKKKSQSSSPPPLPPPTNTHTLAILCRWNP
jgi:hypothetical protein